MATEPPALGTKGKPAAYGLPQLLPACTVTRHEICGREASEAGRDTGHQSNRPVQNRGGGAALASRGPPFVIAMLPKTLLQIVIRAWDGWVVVAVKQARPVAARYLQEVCERSFQHTTVTFGHADRA